MPMERRAAALQRLGYSMDARIARALRNCPYRNEFKYLLILPSLKTEKRKLEIIRLHLPSMRVLCENVRRFMCVGDDVDPEYSRILRRHPVAALMTHMRLIQGLIVYQQVRAGQVAINFRRFLDVALREMHLLRELTCSQLFSTPALSVASLSPAPSLTSLFSGHCTPLHNTPIATSTPRTTPTRRILIAARQKLDVMPTRRSLFPADEVVDANEFESFSQASWKSARKTFLRGISDDERRRRVTMEEDANSTMTSINSEDLQFQRDYFSDCIELEGSNWIDEEDAIGFGPNFIDPTRPSTFFDLASPLPPEVGQGSSKIFFRIVEVPNKTQPFPQDRSLYDIIEDEFSSCGNRRPLFQLEGWDPDSVGIIDESTLSVAGPSGNGPEPILPVAGPSGIAQEPVLPEAVPSKNGPEPILPEAGPSGIAQEPVLPEAVPSGNGPEPILPVAGPSGIAQEPVLPEAVPSKNGPEPILPEAGPSGIAQEPVLPEAVPSGNGPEPILPVAGPSGIAQEPVLPEAVPSGNGPEPILPVAGPSGIAQEPVLPVAGPSGNGPEPILPVAGPSGNGPEPILPVAGPSGIAQEPVLPEAVPSGNGPEPILPVAGPSGNGPEPILPVAGPSDIDPQASATAQGSAQASSTPHPSTASRFPDNSFLSTLLPPDPNHPRYVMPKRNPLEDLSSDSSSEEEINPRTQQTHGNLISRLNYQTSQLWIRSEVIRERIERGGFNLIPALSERVIKNSEPVKYKFHFEGATEFEEKFKESLATFESAFVAIPESGEEDSFSHDLSMDLENEFSSGDDLWTTSEEEDEYDTDDTDRWVIPRVDKKVPLNQEELLDAGWLEQHRTDPDHWQEIGEIERSGPREIPEFPPKFRFRRAPVVSYAVLRLYPDWETRRHPSELPPPPHPAPLPEVALPVGSEINTETQQGVTTTSTAVTPAAGLVTGGVSSTQGPSVGTYTGSNPEPRTFSSLVRNPLSINSGEDVIHVPGESAPGTSRPVESTENTKVHTTGRSEPANLPVENNEGTVPHTAHLPEGALPVGSEINAETEEGVTTTSAARNPLSINSGEDVIHVPGESAPGTSGPVESTENTKVHTTGRSEPANLPVENNEGTVPHTEEERRVVPATVTTPAEPDTPAGFQFVVPGHVVRPRRRVRVPPSYVDSDEEDLQPPRRRRRRRRNRLNVGPPAPPGSPVPEFREVGEFPAAPMADEVQTPLDVITREWDITRVRELLKTRMMGNGERTLRFSDICEPGTCPRKSASSVFRTLLDLQADGSINLYQKDLSGDPTELFIDGLDTLFESDQEINQ